MANNIDSVELQALLSATLRGTYTLPTAWYLALDTTNPANAASASTELTGYTRQTIAFAAPTYSAGTGSCASNTAQTFTSMPASTITGVEIFTAATGTARRLWFGPLTASKTVASGDTLSFAAGAITATLT